MFEYIYDFAKKNNCDFISLIAETENEAAQSFYDSLGYMREVGYVKLVNKKIQLYLAGSDIANVISH